jgi:hypothetical protein
MDTLDTKKTLLPRKPRTPKYTEAEQKEVSRQNRHKYRLKNKDVIAKHNKNYYIKHKYLSEDSEFKYNTKYYQKYIVNPSESVQN